MIIESHFKSFLVIFLIFFIVYANYGLYSLLASDFVFKKTGVLLQYKINGIKIDTDKGRLIIDGIIRSLIVFEVIFSFYILYPNKIFLYICIFYGFLKLYFVLALFIRNKYFFYRNEEKDITKRDYFKYKLNKMSPKSLYPDLYDSFQFRDYLDFSLHHSTYTFISLIGFMMVYMASHIPSIFIGFSIMLIILNILIFPDYLDKIFPCDLRTLEGYETFRKIYNLLVVFSAISIGLPYV